MSKDKSNRLVKGHMKVIQKDTPEKDTESTTNTRQIESDGTNEGSDKAGISWGAWPQTIVFGLFVAYTHFFGFSYRKSYLEGAGFGDIPIKPSPEESIFYAVQGVTDGIMRLLKIEFYGLNPATFMFAISFAILPLMLWNSKKNSHIRATSIRKFIDKSTDSLTRALLLAPLGFLTGYLFQVVMIAITIFLVASSWLIMIMGMQAGMEDGKKLAINPVCEEIDWEKREESKLPGCAKFTTSDGNKELVGVKVHQQEGIRYILTNEASYELDNKGKILSSRPIYTRPELVERSNKSKN